MVRWCWTKIGDIRLSLQAKLLQVIEVTKKRGAFPTPDAVRKVMYLALQRASRKWTRPIHDWPTALNHLALVFPGRVPA